MSIRDISRRTCEQCNVECLHMASKCSNCGHIAKSGNQQYAERVRIAEAELYKAHGFSAVVSGRRQRELRVDRARKKYLRETGQDYKSFPDINTSHKSQALFDIGRGGRALRK